MRKILLAVPLVASLSISGVTKASNVTFHFSGVVENIVGDALGFSVGQTFAGSYSFDSEVTPICSQTFDAFVCSYFYDAPPFGVRLILDGGGVVETKAGSDVFRVIIANAQASPGADSYGIRSEQSSTTIGGMSILELSWELVGGPGVLADTELPLVPPDPNQFAVNRFVIIGSTSPESQFQVLGRFNSMSVPAMSMGGIGCLAFACALATFVYREKRSGKPTSVPSG